MRETLSASAPVATLRAKPRFDFNLEALRGFAALVVVWHHIIYHKYWLDPAYKPAGLLSFDAPGHLSVLVFFVLSGYVIGLAHAAPLQRGTILSYLKKRFSRIYPIYFLSMVLALLVAKHSYPLSTVLGNLTMTQNFLTPVIFENNPAWSLNFEILFYLLFIPISFFQWNSVVITLLVSLAGIILNFAGHHTVAAYALGFVFWLCGLLLARGVQQPRVPSFALMLSMLCLLLSLEQFNVFTTILSKATLVLAGSANNFSTGAIKFSDFSYLPYCLIMVLVFASKEFWFRKTILFVFLLLPALTFYHILKNPGLFYSEHLVLPSCFYLLALSLYIFQRALNRVSQVAIEKLSITGALSYGLYIIHFPIIAIFHRITLFAGSPFTFAGRLLGYVALCILGAYLLEKRFQPWIKRFI